MGGKKAQWLRRAKPDEGRPRVPIFPCVSVLKIMSRTQTEPTITREAQAPAVPAVQGHSTDGFGRSPLPGTPGMPFRTRQLLWAQRESRGAWHQPYLNMAFSIIIVVRCWHLLTPPTATWLAASLALSAADVVWRSRSWRCYSRWRELPAVLLRLNAFAPGAAWLLMGQLLDDHGAPTDPSSSSNSSGEDTGGGAGSGAVPQMAAHLARLLFASGAAKMAANALSLRTRLSLSAAVQVVLVLAAGRHTRAICAAAPLAAPAAQRRTRQLYRLLSALAGTALVFPEASRPRPRSVSGSGTAGPPLQAECAAVITWLRLCLALTLPLLHEAAAEAQLWRRHQRERRQRGLPPEGGVREAPVYRAAGWLASDVHMGRVEEDEDEEEGGGAGDSSGTSSGSVPPGGGGGGGFCGGGGGWVHSALVTWLLLAGAWEWSASILRL